MVNTTPFQVSNTTNTINTITNNEDVDMVSSPQFSSKTTNIIPTSIFNNKEQPLFGAIGIGSMTEISSTPVFSRGNSFTSGLFGATNIGPTNQFMSTLNKSDSTNLFNPGVTANQSKNKF
jgi:hypothetical protein